MFVFALGGAALARQAPVYDVYAVRFAHVSYPVSSLVRGAERGRNVDIAFTVWVMRAGDRVVLLDAGFYREKFISRWKPVNLVTPTEAVRRGLGISPEQVTDVVISHSHWDHADGADLFPRATVWIQKEEYDYYVGPQGEALHGADADVVKMLADLNNAGRVRLVDGDATEILPGITVYTGGKHTYASQYAGVRTAAGAVVLASDNAYLSKSREAPADRANARRRGESAGSGSDAHARRVAVAGDSGARPGGVRAVSHRCAGRRDNLAVVAAEMTNGRPWQGAYLQYRRLEREFAEPQVRGLDTLLELRPTARAHSKIRWASMSRFVSSIRSERSRRRRPGCFMTCEISQTCDRATTPPCATSC